MTEPAAVNLDGIIRMGMRDDSLCSTRALCSGQVGQQDATCGDYKWKEGSLNILVRKEQDRGADNDGHR